MSRIECNYIVLRTHESPIFMLSHYMPTKLHVGFKEAQDEKERLILMFPGNVFRVLSCGNTGTITIEARVNTFVGIYCAFGASRSGNPFSQNGIDAWKNEQLLAEEKKIADTTYDKWLKEYQNTTSERYGLLNPKHPSVSYAAKNVFVSPQSGKLTMKVGNKFSIINPEAIGPAGTITFHKPTTFYTNNKEFRAGNYAGADVWRYPAQKVNGEKPMTIKVTNPVFVNGNSESSYTVDALIALITSAKAAVKALEGVDVKSTTIEKLIAAEEKGITDLLVVLDARAKDIK